MTKRAHAATRLLLITAVAAEADTLDVAALGDTTIVVSGLGRTNAAAATTETIVRHGPFDLVMSVGIAGALPGAGLAIGDAVLASRCVYAEEGLVTPTGFSGVEALGFALGDFDGNAVPVDAPSLAHLRSSFTTGPIATVATCSGSDDAARAIGERTGALAEAMEGAAVVHAARRLGHRGLELRTISNDTGNRATQTWDLPRALAALGSAVTHAVERLRESDRATERRSDEGGGEGE